MKRAALLFALFFITANILSAQNYSWISPNKTYLKMYLAEDGMYRIGQSDFTGAGIATASIDPRTVKVYNKGVQIPIYFNGESDGVFGISDYFDFYGVRNYGGNTITYDQNNTPVYTTNEYFNIYSDTNVYWIDWGGSNGLRYSQSTYTASLNYSNQYFNDIVHLEKDIFYSQGENISSSDYRFLSTEKFRGEGWYWSSLGNTQTLSDTFSLPLLYSVPQTSSVKLFGYPTVRNTTTTNEHSLQIKVNGTLVATAYANDLNKIDTTVTFSSSLLTSGAVNTVSVTYGYISSPSAPTSNMYIDFMEVQYPRIFKFRNEKVSSVPGGSDTTSKVFSVSGYNNLNQINIFDVVNNIRISNYTNILDTLKFTGKSNGNFIMVNNLITKKPFRIKQRLVPDLVSSSNGADYLVIYHSLFTSQAEQLRAYRQSHDGYRAFKAEIEDIYDIFNYGIENPIAVKNFTKHIYDNWTLPKLGYICLLGRGSLDPKKNMPGSSYNNLIPVYGYPPSDGYFANLNIGTFFYYDMIAIGRLPAYYSSEAQSMVDKIISYESQSPGLWSKTYTYITGGGTIAEQNTHQAKSNSEISTYITPPPLSGEAHKIYRSDTSGSVTFNMKDSIVKDFDRGVGYVNFRGHAGSHDWEVAMSDPNTLNNGTKLPLILSLTCFTGENSKSDYRGFGERFIYLNNKGAIGFIGTTGWSYAQQGNDFGTWIINGLKNDSTRRIGDLTKYANKKMSVDSISFNVRHTVNCYSLLGDPALKLKIPVRPEFQITSADYKISNDFPIINENVVLTVYPKNYGTFADSCKIRFQLKKDNQNYSVKDTVRKNFAQNDSINYSFSIDSIGNYSVVVTLDYGNYYPLEDKSNNSITITLPVKNTSFVPLRPVNNALVSTDSIEFAGLNPIIKTSAANIRVMLQMDTTASFNSPVKRFFFSKNIGGPVTKFLTDIPVKVNNLIYYWRTNCVINNDSSGWTKPQTFVYSTVALTKAVSNDSKSPENNAAGNVSLFKIKSSQYSSTDYSNTVHGASGISLYDFPGNLFVRSYGSNAEESSYFSIGTKNIYVDGGLNTGLNLLKVKKLTGSIQAFKNFRMTSSTSPDSIVTFLNTFDTTQYLMLLNAAYTPGGVYLNSVAKTKLRQFGSIYCDSITLTGYFHTWSLIGFLGANSSQVNESFDPCCRNTIGCTGCDHWTESTSTRDVTFRKTSGTVSSVAGPAQIWQNFSWTQTLYPNSSIYFDVYGIDNLNNQTLLLSNVQSNTFTDLSAINAYQYPRLNFVAKLAIDTLLGGSSPLLNSIKINYIAPSEITYDINSLDYISSYIPGQEFKFTYNYFNSGSYDVPGVVTNVFQKSMSNSNLLITDTSSAPLTVNDARRYSNRFNVPDFRDSVKIIIENKPKGPYNESYTFNNTIEISMKSSQMRYSPMVKVYSDGQLIQGGDNVRTKPEIKIDVMQAGPVSSKLKTDTSRVAVKLNNQYVPFYINGVINPVIKPVTNDNSSSTGDVSLMFYPELQRGSNRLSVIYHSGEEAADTVSYDVIVSDELTVKNLTNYPNPMKSETNFVFEIEGAEISSKFVLKIYTVSGRLIKEINYPVNIGYNQIPWDGKDSDGDYVSNGTYLYKLVSEGDIKVETAAQKLVMLR